MAFQLPYGCQTRMLLWLSILIHISCLIVRTASNGNTLHSVTDYQLYIRAICHVPERCKNNFCSGSPQSGCAYYNNGTCVLRDVNRCTDCKDPDVFAVLEGYSCPDNYPNLCRPVSIESVYCPPAKYDACVCTIDGVCVSKKANSCQDCKKNSVLAVFQGNCPYDFLQCNSKSNCNCDQTSNNLFTCNQSGAYKCTLNDKGQSCTSVTQTACVCYKNATCETTSSNRCIACSEDQVDSIYEGASCPTTCLN